MIRAYRDGLDFPATPDTIVQYVSDTLSRGLAPSTINHHLSALRCFHLEAFGTNPVEDNRVKKSRVSARKIHYMQRALSTVEQPSASSKIRVYALDPRVISFIMRSVFDDSWCEWDTVTIRMLACICIGYLFMLRPITLLNVHGSDFKFPTVATFRLSLRWEKNQIEYAAATEARVVAASEVPPSLYAFIAAAARSAGRSPLFPAVPGDNFERDRSRSVLNAAIAHLFDLVRPSLSEVFVPADYNYSSRSLRAGGASAADSLRVDGRQLDRVAGWRAEHTHRLYVRSLVAPPGPIVARLLAVAFDVPASTDLNPLNDGPMELACPPHLSLATLVK